jgi:uncharacterized protein (TIGR00369 family)
MRAVGKRDELGAFEFDPHHCFACGELNEGGLRLEIHTDPNGAWTEAKLDAAFQGWEAVAHGGIVCTLLDEVMAWSVIGRGTWGVTARLNVAFLRPIPTGREIRAEGWVVEQHRRAARTAARVLDKASGEVLATAEGTFVGVPHAQLEALKKRYGMRRPAVETTTGGRTTDDAGGAVDVLGGTRSSRSASRVPVTRHSPSGGSR